jgi:hypothetical protein
MTDAADEKENFSEILVDRFVVERIAGRMSEAAESGREAAFQRVEKSPQRAFHHGKFVINWRHDSRDRVGGDASHQRNDCTSGGSTEQL